MSTDSTIASITRGSDIFRFRTNPNAITWDYTLNTKVEETYGGRVIQILSTKIENLVVTADSGLGGWDYLYQAATFFRNLLVDQRNGEPATFEYPARNYVLKVYATAFPFRDDWNAVLRPFSMNFKVQEDVSGVISSNTISSELSRINAEGIGFRQNPYNFTASGTSGGLNDAPDPVNLQASGPGQSPHI